MNSEIITEVEGISAPIGPLNGGAGFVANHGSIATTQSQAHLGSAIQSYEPLRPKWEPDGALESDGYCGPPFVLDAEIDAALPELRLALSHAEKGCIPATKAQILSLIGTLRLSKNAAKLQGSDAQGRVAAMMEELRDIPADILRSAIWKLRTERASDADDWFPTGGKIRAAAMSELARRVARKIRLKEWILELEKRQEAMKSVTLTPAEQAELDAFRRRYVATDKEPAKVQGYVPSPDDPPPGIDKATWAKMLASSQARKEAREAKEAGQ